MKTYTEVNVNTYIAIFEFIESWYNNNRIHSSIDYKTPNEKYNEYLKNIATPQAKLDKSIKIREKMCLKT